MIYEVEVSEQADSDLRGIFEYIAFELQSPENAIGQLDRLEEQIFGAVMAFARTGKPEYEGLPQWPASREDDEATMIFDRVCEVRHNHDDRLLKLHAEASPKFDLAAMMAKMGDEIQH